MKGYNLETGETDIKAYDPEDWDRLLVRIARKRATKRKRAKQDETALRISLHDTHPEEHLQGTVTRLNWDRAKAETPTPPSSPGRYRLTFGKHRGQPIAAIPSDYLRWLRSRPDMPDMLVALMGEELERRGRLVR